MQTVKQLIDTAHNVCNGPCDNDFYATIRMVAWYSESLGKTTACNVYTRHLAAQQERAEKCRYHEMARKVLGNPGRGYIYMPGYNEMAEIGSWEVTHA